jgi:hypothetical protein
MAAAIALLIIAGVPRCVRAQQSLATAGTQVAIATFLGSLQHAVRAGDRASVARLVHYPLRVNHGPARHQTIRNSAELLASYARIFAPAIRSGILAQKVTTLSSSPSGIAIAQGAVWAQMFCNPRSRPVCRVGLTSVNLGG